VSTEPPSVPEWDNHIVVNGQHPFKVRRQEKVCTRVPGVGHKSIAEVEQAPASAAVEQSHDRKRRLRVRVLHPRHSQHDPL
jgi:hypothetical protein